MTIKVNNSNYNNKPTTRIVRGRETEKGGERTRGEQSCLGGVNTLRPPKWLEIDSRSLPHMQVEIIVAVLVIVILIVTVVVDVDVDVDVDVVVVVVVVIVIIIGIVVVSSSLSKKK